MKKIIVSLFVLSSLVACKKDCDTCEGKECNPSPDSTLVCKTDLSKGLLAYYPFSGNYNDASGNGNTATAKGGAFLTTDYMGRASSSAGFDGYDDYLIVPGSSKLNSDTFTVSVQVMVNTINRRHNVVTRVHFDNATAVSMGLGVALPTDNKFNFGVVPNTEDCSVVHAAGSASSIYANNNIQAGRWYNLVVSFAGGVQKFYINGVLNGSATRSYTKAKRCDNSDLVIGGWWKSDVVSIDGKIDDVRLYNRVLTDCELNQLAEAFKD
jgi:hypothetical protein